MTLVWTYVFGVLVGLWRTDAPPARRLGLALLWPVAAIACIATLTVLGIAAAALFPVVGVAAVVAGGVAWAIWG